MSKELTTLLEQRLRDYLAGAWERLELAAQEAQKLERPLYLVGGAVRDFFLGRASRDLDLVVEGNGDSVARLVSALGPGGSQPRAVHERFGTARGQWQEWRLDVAMARSESYVRPGALPTVRPGSLQDDLRRRDFAINAMAVSLAPSRGELADPFRGRQDLEAGLIRILHPRSFQDDPTRILRALRYAARLGFRLEEDTEACLHRDLAFLDLVSPDRQRHELELTLQEEAPEMALLLAQERGVLAAMHSALRVEARLFPEARRSGIAPSPARYLALLAYPLSTEECRSLLQHFRFPRPAAQAIADTPRLRQALPGVPLSPLSRLHQALAPFSPEAVFACAVGTDSPEVRQALLRYLQVPVSTHLRGEDLLRLGVGPGPRVGQMLRTLLEAHLDGKVTTRADEEALVRQMLARGQGP